MGLAKAAVDQCSLERLWEVRREALGRPRATGRAPPLLYQEPCTSQTPEL